MRLLPSCSLLQGNEITQELFIQSLPYPWISSWSYLSVRTWITLWLPNLQPRSSSVRKSEIWDRISCLLRSPEEENPGNKVSFYTADCSQSSICYYFVTVSRVDLVISKIRRHGVAAYPPPPVPLWLIKDSSSSRNIVEGAWKRASSNKTCKGHRWKTNVGCILDIVLIKSMIIIIVVVVISVHIIITSTIAKKREVLLRLLQTWS